MRRMGFDEWWILRVLACVKFIVFRAIVNEEKVGPITPNRGLRQGSPLSRYLFILCVESLGALLNKEVVNGQIHGVSVYNDAPSISYIFFADDNLLFCRAGVEEAQKLKAVIKACESSSDQIANFGKSSIFFSPSTMLDVRDRVMELLGVQLMIGEGKHVSLPSLIGMRKKEVFTYLYERVWWQTKR